MRRRDSPTEIERLPDHVDEARGVTIRSVVLPRDYQFVASANPEIGTQALGDGRWFVQVPVDELGEMTVSTITQLRSGHGRISDRRYALIRALVSEEEWRQAEGIVAAIGSLGPAVTS